MPSPCTRRNPVQLGYDELSAVMILAAGDSVDAKFNVAQVSSSWRRVALSTPRLWSCFRIHSLATAFRLPVIMERASHRMSVPLDASLDFTALKQMETDEGPILVPVFARDVREGIYLELRPHMPHMRRLTVNCGTVADRDEPLASMFEFPTPMLEHLAVILHPWMPVNNSSATQQPVIPLQEVPRLRSLAFTSVVPTSWNTVLRASIETLHLNISIEDPDFLVYVINKCPRLSSFSFQPICGQPNFEFRGDAFVHTALCNLRMLRLSGPIRNIWNTLLPMLNSGGLASFTAWVSSFSPPVSVEAMGRCLSLGLGPPVSLAVNTLYHPSTGACLDICLLDAAGRERRLLIDRSRLTPQSFADFWNALPANIGDASSGSWDVDSIRSVHLSTPNWGDFALALEQRPLQHPGIKLRIQFLQGDPFVPTRTVWGSVAGHLPGITAGRTLTFLTLRMVVLEFEDGTGLSIRAVRDILDHIHVTLGSSVKLCVSEAFARQDSVMTSDFLLILEEELDERPGWELCEHCVSRMGRPSPSASTFFF